MPNWVGLQQIFWLFIEERQQKQQQQQQQKVFSVISRENVRILYINMNVTYIYFLLVYHCQRRFSMNSFTCTDNWRSTHKDLYTSALSGPWILSRRSAKERYSIGTDGEFELRKYLLMIIYIYIYKVGDLSEGWPEGSLFNSYYTEV